MAYSLIEYRGNKLTADDEYIVLIINYLEEELRYMNDVKLDSLILAMQQDIRHYYVGATALYFDDEINNDNISLVLTALQRTQEKLTTRKVIPYAELTTLQNKKERELRIDWKEDLDVTKLMTTLDALIKLLSAPPDQDIIINLVN